MNRLLSYILTALGIIATAAAVLVEPAMADIVGMKVAHVAPFIGAIAVALGRQLSPVTMGQNVNWLLVLVGIAGVITSYAGLLGDLPVKLAALVLAIAGAFTRSPLDADGDGIPDIFERE